MKKKSLLLSTVLISTTLLAGQVAADETEVSLAQESNVSQQTSVVSNEQATPSSVETNTPSAEVAEVTAESTNQAQEETPAATTEDASTADNQSEELAPASETNSDDTITVLHTNDMHGRIVEESSVIGTPKLAEVVKESRSQGTTLVLDSGDAFQGLPISNSTKGEDMATLMNEIGYDAMAIGNHEFDFGLDQLKKLKELLQFPLLSANTYVNGARLFEASTIIDKNKEVVGDEVVVIGVTTPETATKTHPRNVVGVTFSDPIAEVTSVIAEIEARAKAEGKSYNKYIILAHLGVDTTTPTEWQGSTLAEALSQNALLSGKNVLVLDGHSHTAKVDTYGNVTYNQTGSYLNHIGKIVLNSEKVLENSLITTEAGKALKEDETVAALVKTIQEKYAAENAVVVLDKSPVELNGQRENVRVRETNLGNIVADALYDYGQTGFSHPTDLAVTNGGGLRETIQKDKPITKGDIIAVLPFGNIISQIEVTGQQIKDMFIKSLGSINQVDSNGNVVLDENGQPLLEPSGGFLQISGARVYYDTTLPADQRVLAIQILDHASQTYKDLVLDKVYYLATNDFLAAGGDGYTMLGGSREEGPSMDGVFADFLAKADLTEYAVINPNSRTISIKSSELATYLTPKETEPTKNNTQQSTQNTTTTTTLELSPSGQTHTITISYQTAAFKPKAQAAHGQNKVKGNLYFGQALAFADGDLLTLPLTASNRSIAAVLVGFVLLLVGLIGVRRKRH